MIVILFLGLWLGVCGYALWLGGRPEQFVALSFVVAFVLIRPSGLFVTRERSYE